MYVFVATEAAEIMMVDESFTPLTYEDRLETRERACSLYPYTTTE